MKKIPVVIDCDPGIDDAYALFLAFASDQLDVRAVTTVAGNKNVDVTTENALRVAELADVNVPVARGCDHPLLREPLEEEDMFHGANGLGDVALPTPKLTLSEKNAVETMRTLAGTCDGALQIIAIGPLTNVALLFRLYPEVKTQIAHLTVMGGALSGGNVAPESEFNFFCDPEAAQIVMCSGVPITLVDLTGCENAGLREEDAALIAGQSGGISDFLKQVFKFQLALSRSFGGDSFVVHDAIAVASVIDPALLQTAPCTVRVETGGGETYGKSIVDFCADGPVRMTTGVDREKFIAMSRQMTEHY